MVTKKCRIKTEYGYVRTTKQTTGNTMLEIEEPHRYARVFLKPNELKRLIKC